jgi:alpha-galactosidase
MFNKYDLPAGPFVAKIASSSETALAAAAAPPSSEGVGVCKTPPMGVNTWNAFHCNVDERKMRAMADAIVSSGLSKAGYEYGSLTHS